MPLYLQGIGVFLAQIYITKMFCLQHQRQEQGFGQLALGLGDAEDPGQDQPGRLARPINGAFHKAHAVLGHLVLAAQKVVGPAVRLSTP